MAVTVLPSGNSFDPNTLLEPKDYRGMASFIYIPTPKCLAATAFGDSFPDDPNSSRLRTMLSETIMRASPGWHGTFGPIVSNLAKSPFEGNYDMTQMLPLLPLAYSYYDELTPEAQNRLITLLLARGRVHRASISDDVFTSGGVPNDWARAGYVSAFGVKLADIPETKNHVLMIGTARQSGLYVVRAFRTAGLAI
jgi:hypothetical protein